MYLRIINFLTALLFISLASNWYLYRQNQTLLQATMQNGGILTHTDEKHSNPASTSQSSNGQLPRKWSELLQQAQEQFNNKDFAAALNILTDLESHSPELFNRLLKQWFIQIDNWIQSESRQQALEFLDVFLHYFPFHLQGLERKAKLHDLNNERMLAIEVYYQVYDNTLEDNIKQKQINRTHALATEHFTELSANHNWSQLIQDAQHLLVMEPAYPPYQLQLAKALINQKQFDQAKDLLNHLMELPSVRPEAIALFNSIQAQATGQQRLALTKSNTHYIVRGRFNDKVDVNLMIDTGASLSVLSTKMFSEINQWVTTKFVEYKLFNTAGGEIEAPIYKFLSFQLADYQVQDIHFAVIKMENMKGAEGLLGMNFLQHFNFKIDQINSELVLAYQ